MICSWKRHLCNRMCNLNWMMGIWIWESFSNWIIFQKTAKRDIGLIGEVKWITFVVCAQVKQTQNWSCMFIPSLCNFNDLLVQYLDITANSLLFPSADVSFFNFVTRYCSLYLQRSVLTKGKVGKELFANKSCEILITFLWEFLLWRGN